MSVVALGPTAIAVAVFHFTNLPLAVSWGRGQPESQRNWSFAASSITPQVSVDGTKDYSAFGQIETLIPTAFWNFLDPGDLCCLIYSLSPRGHLISMTNQFWVVEYLLMSIQNYHPCSLSMGWAETTAILSLGVFPLQSHLPQIYYTDSEKININVLLANIQLRSQKV